MKLEKLHVIGDFPKNLEKFSGSSYRLTPLTTSVGAPGATPMSPTNQAHWPK